MLAIMAYHVAMPRYLFVFLLLALAGASLAGQRNEPIAPLIGALDLDPGKVALGARIYHDASLSDSGRIACASCHDLGRGGTDWRSLSIDSRGRQRRRNTPTIFNATHNYLLHWDGRFSDPSEEARDGITASESLNTPLPHFLARLRARPSYRERFEALYADGLDEASVIDALVTFERSLTTPDSDFDRYLCGDDDALSDAAREGYRLFKQLGCISCHQGVDLGGNLYARIGIAQPIPEDDPVAEDPGLYVLSGREEDRHVFRVPSLRNVAVTPPYLHNGSVDSLDETVRLMGLFQLGRRIPPVDRRRIVAFLRSLTGRYRGRKLIGPAPATVGDKLAPEGK